MLYITFDLSSHRVSWFFLHMASWIKMSGNFYVSVASLVAFITLFCSISQRYMQLEPGPSFPQFEVKIPPTVITSKTLFKRNINQFGIQKHTCISTIHVSHSDIFTFFICFYTYPLNLRLPRRCHTQKPANVAMRDPSLHDVVTAASAPWTVPKKVPPRANGSSNHGGNHGENEENEVFSFWILGVFSD